MSEAPVIDDLNSRTTTVAAELPVDIAPTEPVIELPDCDGSLVVEIVDQLDLHPLVAQTLVRRGITTVDQAAAVIGTTKIEDPTTLPGVLAAAEAVAAHLRADTRVAVHGDYDVDGVSSTAIMVRSLTRLGADVTWHVPSRFDEGYGLSIKAIDRLAQDGVGLIVAVDCGIGSVREVEHARALGVDVVICDHHKPGDVLPDAPIVHPALCDYACPTLCAAAVTFKLAQVLTQMVGGDLTPLEEELELVALATVCDVVPLRGENRAFVQRGTMAMRSTMRPGLRELMRVAGVDQLRLDARSFGFALGPRINAAGRMYSAEPAVELMLTSNDARAAELADELAAANFKRREIEQNVLQMAESQARVQRDRYAIVVVGEGWHPGVLGIVAGRLAETYRRPAIALSSENGVLAGSGRNGGTYDLHAGLAACSDHLVRFGGHRAAAGLELDEAALPAFIRDLNAHASAALTVDDLRPRFTVDAVGEPSQITLATVDQLDRLGPFGAENREPLVLLPGVEVVELRKMGDRKQHRKLSIAGRGAKANVVAFGWESAIEEGVDAPLVNLIVELGRNEFRGSVEPQAKLKALTTVVRQREDAWMTEFVASFDSAPLDEGIELVGRIDPNHALDRRDDSPLSIVAELGGTAANAALVVNDVLEWQQTVTALAQIDARLADVRVLSYDDRSLNARGIDHFILAEPPPIPAFAEFGDAQVTIAWNSATVRLTAGRGSDLLLARNHAVAFYRALKASEGGDMSELAASLARATPSPRIAARAAQALSEVSVLALDRNGDAVEAIHALESANSDLELSSTFRSYSACREESERWLRQLTEQQTPQR